MTKEEIRQKAVDNAKRYEVWPPVADYQDGLIKGFEDCAEWIQERMIERVVEWLRGNIDEDVSIPCGNVIKIISADEFVEYFIKSMEEEK